MKEKACHIRVVGLTTYERVFRATLALAWLSFGSVVFGRTNMSANYSVVTVVKIDSDYQSEALGLIGELCTELKAQAGALTTRYGVIATGDQAGSLILLQSYEEMNGIDAAFGVYGSSAAYQSLIGSGRLAITLRNILKIEPVALANQSAEVPAYGVLTRWGSADAMADRVQALTGAFEENGAMFLRYWTILTGNAAGRRLMAAAYPSMDSIEKTYDALRANPDYPKFIGDVDLDFRNIVRIAG
jgi:Domain of unknown function (DUF6854)